MAHLPRREFLKQSVLGLAGAGIACTLSCSKSAKSPNIVIIFMDDMGYGDWGYSGHPTIRRLNLERMAREGVMMTQFYSACSFCTPSRASLLTGRYYIRTGVYSVLFPFHETGLPQKELTIAGMLKQKGYATACVGKWHLGHLPEYLPTNHGFDTYYGIPYSNDMTNERRGDPPLPLMRNTEIIEQPCDQTTLTKRYTEESIRFIHEHRDKPFFLYLPHTMPHIPLYRSEKFENQSLRGLYGDVIEELDWSIGQILNALKENGVDDNTLVIVTSDNGPWTMKDLAGGSAGLLRGGKASTFEGGIREPFIARFPGVLPEGEIRTEVGIMTDIFPTCLNLAGVPLPDDRIIDGADLMPLLKGEGKSRHETLYFYHDRKLRAVRHGKYKLHLSQHVGNWQWKDCESPELYDLEADPSEQYDIGAQHPRVVAEITRLADQFEQEIKKRGENLDTIREIQRGFDQN